MSRKRLEYKALFNKKFERAEQELDKLKFKIKATTGDTIFKRHSYKRKELLESEHFSKIFAISMKIGDDVYNWVKNGKLPQEGFEEYLRCRSRLRRRMDYIHRLLQNRKETNWEKIIQVFKDITKIIIDNLPSVGKIISITRDLIEAGNKRAVKLLPPKRKQTP